MYKHKKFILTPISEILREAVMSCKSIGKGIETYPLSDYIMQSVFIRMTGAQEQKMKCILWSLADNDFDFRYEFLKQRHGEYSSYSDKNKVYQGLLKQIGVIKSDYRIGQVKMLKDRILKASNISGLLDKSNVSVWSNKKYKDYLQIWKQIQIKNFAIVNNTLIKKNKLISLQTSNISEFTLLGKNDSIDLKKIYEDHLYRNRNKIAHNTKSYQHHLPTFNSLKKEEFIYENYFLWFSILILIDHIFIELYMIYLETQKQRKFM